MHARVEDSLGICELCPRRCKLQEGATGACRVRTMIGGRIIPKNYGAITSMAIDPIEKKPLYHFMPGSGVLSVGTFGCNLSCRYCQNWEISQRHAESRFFTPDQLADLAESMREQSVGVAYTYSEPFVWYEFVYDCAKLVHEIGLSNILVTNGYINPEPLAGILPYVDAINVDLKGYDDEYYRKVCGGTLAPVISTIRAVYESGCHLELTTLVVPGYNDSPEEMEQLASWVASLSPEIPLHISRYFPSYRMNEPPTPMATMEKCVEVAKRRLNYVYVGNASIPGGSDTVCPNCGELLIERRGFACVTVRLEGVSCPKCGHKIPVRLAGGESAGNKY
ncbi:MAG TPA: AmmeMemoRadiSam system radical SAM enzyme [Bacillota bacterium]|jgi:pyruvate formate lyase activating enzyme|nr:AmmeMemoRadiSam system radical SAM enzyme [Bacillota bacterium]HOL51641.1 AmmeMemoRadiSam system radical SAM enzyme [Bacillota bacterium]HOO29359.1 AmmeMemoRadiSam system radical SAM enzyme [Bacillota bacterium]HPQ03163.1 AmmeMemoRadiSam system radical SAM enzyme [Bacillota bacterium]